MLTSKEACVLFFVVSLLLFLFLSENELGETGQEISNPKQKRSDMKGPEEWQEEGKKG